jgi:hypothetical protein
MIRESSEMPSPESAVRVSLSPPTEERMSGDVRGTRIYLYELAAGGGEDPEKLVKRLRAANVACIYV